MKLGSYNLGKSKRIFLLKKGEFMNYLDKGRQEADRKI